MAMLPAVAKQRVGKVDRMVSRHSTERYGINRSICDKSQLGTLEACPACSSNCRSGTRGLGGNAPEVPTGGCGRLVFERRAPQRLGVTFVVVPRHCDGLTHTRKLTTTRQPRPPNPPCFGLRYPIYRAHFVINGARSNWLKRVPTVVGEQSQ